MQISFVFQVKSHVPALCYLLVSRLLDVTDNIVHNPELIKNMTVKKKSIIQ